MPDEILAESLQEAVLAVLTFNDNQGMLIAGQVVPENFDGIYREVSSAVLAYRHRYHKAPGEAHLESLFSRAKLDPADRKTHALRRTLVNLSATAEQVNAEYVVTRAQDFIRSQKLRGALLQANERYLQGGDDAVPEVEGILHAALRFRQQTLDAGSYLNNVDKALEFTRKQEDFCPLGIKEFDSLGVGLVPRQLLLYLAPKSSGKTWFCIHSGRQAILNKQRVVHISLEMDEGRILSRYYQSFFGIARRSGAFNRATLKFDELERLTGIKMRKTEPKLSYTSPDIRKVLRAKMTRWGARFGRLVVKHFPANTLTMSQLRGYLDHLELVEKFIPNVLIVDYPRLMRMDPDNLRIILGQVVVDLRGLADERNLSVVIPGQSNRAGIGARRVRSTNASEDISTVFTADTVLSYSRTDAEERLGLARLSFEHGREAQTGLQVLLTQNYAMGQYIADSAYLSGAYWEALKDLTGEEPTPEA